MAGADIIDIDELRRNRPALFRDPASMAGLRLTAHDVGQGLAALPSMPPIAAAMAAPDFGAYAPDPDADYERGRKDGWREAVAEQLLFTIRERRWSPREKAVLFVLQVGLPLALLGFLFWNGRS